VLKDEVVDTKDGTSDEEKTADDDDSNDTTPADPKVVHIDSEVLRTLGFITIDRSAGGRNVIHDKEFTFLHVLELTLVVLRSSSSHAFSVDDLVVHGDGIRDLNRLALLVGEEKIVVVRTSGVISEPVDPVIIEILEVGLVSLLMELAVFVDRFLELLAAKKVHLEVIALLAVAADEKITTHIEGNRELKVIIRALELGHVVVPGVVTIGVLDSSIGKLVDLGVLGTRGFVLSNPGLVVIVRNTENLLVTVKALTLDAAITSGVGNHNDGDDDTENKENEGADEEDDTHHLGICWS